jgi:regulator of sirC expression with transglutaminase-like and TPR domain
MLDSLLELLALDPAADVDLAVVALHLAVDEYPDLDVPVYLDRLAELANRARPYLGGSLEECVTGLCRFLFDDEGFAGNTDHYYDPRNSYLNEVLDRKLGIPITLSMLAMAVGRHVELNIVGVGLPGHFIAKAVRDGKQVLFDPFHGGDLLTPEGCEELVTAVTGRAFPMTPDLLAPTPPGLIVIRMLNNLRSIYTQQEDFVRVARVLGRLWQLVPADEALRRDIGAALLRSGKPGPAIDHLRAYLEAAPNAADAEDVRTLLGRALADVARWN